MHLARLALSIVATMLCAAPAPAATTPAVADFSTCDKPVWPKESVLKSQHGTVTLAFMISEGGAVTDSKVVESSGFPLLDMAARDGIMKCRFVPATQDGKARAAWKQMQYVWKREPVAPDPAALAAMIGADREAAGAGDTAAALRLAEHFLLTEEGMVDKEEGGRWLRKAAAGGDPKAMEFLGSMLFEGHGVTQDKVEAVRWLERAAEAGSPSAQTFYGLLLMHGDGVARNEPVGEQWVTRAARQGHVHAQVQLVGLRLARGTVDADTIALLQRAIDQGNASAWMFLARCYEIGAGVTQDGSKAFALYARAAARGIAEATGTLAILYNKGMGLPEDRLAARTILGLAEEPPTDIVMPAAAAQ
ncbi:TonB family protein [Pseudoduganella dura]|nr:TonB family protein [Pseudoduganella dura]GGX87889.1 hypothetical protein GCM10007386_18420 [Pseudoduganella dura]